MSPEYLWFFGWSALLSAMLFFPVSKLVWALSVRRQQRKLERQLTEAEVTGQMLVMAFAMMFNANIFGFPGAK